MGFFSKNTKDYIFTQLGKQGDPVVSQESYVKVTLLSFRINKIRK